MTGVGEIIGTVRRTVRRSPTIRSFLLLLDYFLETRASNSLSACIRHFIFPGWWAEDIAGRATPFPLQRRPNFRTSMALMPSADSLGIVNDLPASRAWCRIPKNVGETVTSRLHPEYSGGPRQWGLLLPLTSRNSSNVWKPLKHTLQMLVESIPPAYRTCTHVYVAIDRQDPSFDNDCARKKISLLLRSLAGVHFASPLVPAFQGKMCWIWAHLAARAVAAGSELVVLLGDDVIMHDYNWQEDVERQFLAISLERGLPLGCGCVAIRDVSISCFPTFPVIHRMHIEIFNGNLFPPEFINQHGDPFLFELYRRWGASRYTTRSTLTNNIGGFGEARYRKASVHWKGQVLSSAIEQLHKWLANACPTAKQVACIDVIVPTYRCDVKRLQKLCSLECSQPVSLHTILVVDNPESLNLEEVRGLATFATDRTVRVHVQEKNAGASFARNTGLAQSFGDYAVLLDDDVIPMSGLLDAYASAIARHPGEAIYIGMTLLPQPKTLVQCAMNASRICYFYKIAAVRKSPPWGVTANMCVRSRTIRRNFEFFSRKYPKTGGGEDVDFCIRSAAAGHGIIVSVPNAQVVHPYWDKPFKQVMGWASGDVLCLGNLPQAAFYALPNWAEIALMCILYGLFCTFSSSEVGKSGAQNAFACALFAPVVEVFMLFPRFFWFTGKLPKNRTVVGILASTLPMVQDVVRLCSKLKRGRLDELCKHFDWMNKTGQHPAEIRSNLTWKFVAWFGMAWALQPDVNIKFPVTFVVTLYTLWVAKYVGPLMLGDWCPQISRPGLDVEFDKGKTPFVVLAYQRTGSNMLVRNHLNKHKDIHMHFELFNEKAIYTQSNPGSTTPGAIRDIAAISARDNDPAVFLADMIRASPTKAVGFKLFPEHVRELEFFERLLADRRIHKIILRRHNELACVSSIIRASLTGEYIQTSLNKAPDRQALPVHISANDFQIWTDCYDQYYAFLRDRLAGQLYEEITYESLVADPDRALRPVYDLLGLEAQSTASSGPGDLQPQSSTSLRDAVVNYVELANVFSSTSRAPDFD